MKKGILIFIVSMLAFSLMAAKLPVIGERYDAPPYQPTETAVLDEGFEGGVLPTGWTQEYVSGTFDWTYQNGGQFGNPGAAHTGSFNAIFYQSNYNGNTTKLITPQLDLSTLAAANLTFWHTQAVWAGDHDILKVYYKDSSVASWTLLAEYLTNYPVWTEETIALPNLSNDYYIAFEAMGAYGYGVCLDDVVVDEAAVGVNYTIDLVDSYGDGWNGGLLDLSVNGVVVLDDITLLTGAGPETYTFAVEDGDFVEIFYTAGSWPSENEYYVYDHNGNLILSSGTAGAIPNAYESFTVLLGTPSVDFTIDLVDSYGDGWNGGLLDLSVNGVVVLDDITLLTGAGPETYTFAVEDGDFVEIFYTAGSWPSENEYYVYDNNGNLILSSGTAGAIPNAYESFTVNLGTTPTPLNGTYVIDQLGAGNYLSFNDAVADLITQGIDGPVVFEVAAGTYYEQVVIPEITGASATNTITFVGIDGVRQDAILTFEPFDNASRHIVQLPGAKHIRFDNLAVVVGATAAYGWPFHIMNDSQDIQILNSTISTLDNSTSSYYVPIVISNSTTIATTGTSNVFDIVIDNNVIYGGYYGVSANGTSTSPLLGLEITNNLIAEGYYYGIRAYYTTSPLLNNNTIPMRSTGTTTTSGYGIYIYYVYDQFECSYNNITDMGQYGIYVYNATNPATDNPSLIVNNAIGGGFRNTATTACGLYISTSENIGIYYNSINNDSSQGRAIYTLSSASLLNIRNNSFAFTGSGAGYAAYIQSSASLIANDYNNYYSGTSTNFVYYDANVADLAALQLVGIPVGNDANSLQGDPMYTGQYDLLPYGPQLSDAGTPIAGIDDDIVGNLRDLVTPCIGAYEFDPPTNPVLTVNPTSYDFGTVFLNATSNPQVFSMTNTGGGSMNINSVVLSGTNSDQFILTDMNTYPAVLNSGDAITIDVVFAPTSEGLKNAEITITDSRSRLVTVVPLSGTGYDPTVSSFPWTENFDGTWSGTPAAPLGWTVINANNDSYYWSQSNTYISPTHSVPYAAHGMGNTDDWLITPPIDLTGINVRLKWWDKVESTSYPNSYKVFISTTDSQISSFTNELGDYTCTNTAWTEHNLDLDSYNGEVIYIAFYQYASASTYYGFGIDDVLIEEIPAVPVFAIDPQEKDFGLLFVGETSAPQTFTITNSGGAAGQILDVSIIGSNADQFALANLGTLPITVTAGSFSIFDVIYSPTIAEPVTATLAIEYGNSTFDNVTLSGRAFPADYVFEGFDATAFPPGGWTNDGWSRSSTNYMGGGSAYKYGSTSTQYILSTPLLNIGAADVLNFWGRVSSLTGNLDIVYSADGASWTLLETVTYSATNTWENKTIDLSSLGRANYYIGFRTGLQSSSFYIDNVIHPPIVLLPPEPPTNPNPADDAVNVLETAILSWTNGFATETVDVYFGTDSTLVTNKDVSVKVVDDLDVASYDPGIMAYSTEFFWKVVCKNSVTRAETDGPLWSFTTRDDPTLYPPFVEDFSTWYPLNWTKAQGLLADPVVFTSTTTSYWAEDGFANVGNTGAAKCNIWSNNRKDWMITPPIDLNSRTSYLLTFDLALTDYYYAAPITSDPNGTTGIDDKFAVVISLDQGQTWSSANTLRLWDNAGSSYVYNDISYTGESVVIDISAYSGNTVLIGFYGESTVSNADNDLFVDNVSVIIAGALAGNVSEFVADAVIEGALVEIDGQTALTDANGDYLIESLYPGTYEVTCSADGYISQTILDLEITAGAPTIQNFILNWAECVVNPSTITENIESGAFQTVQVTITNTGNGPLEYTTDIELLTDAFDQRRTHNDLEFMENGWLSITSNASGTIAAGNSAIMDVLLDAAGLSGVTKTGNINITHNGQNVTEAVASVPVTMNVNLVTTPPNPATNPIPANNAVDVDLLPTLSWTNHGVVNQTVIEYRTNIFTPWRVWATLIGDDNQYTLEQDQILEYNKTYTWRVTNSNIIGSSVPTNWNFTTITAVAQNPTPDNGEVNVFVDTILDWDDVPYADEYKVYLWYDDGLADTQVFVVNGEVALTSDFIMAEDLLFNTEYFWKIETYRTSRLQGTSAVWSFTTITAEPLAPFNPTPADDAVDISPFDITLEWECPNADSYDVYLDPAGTGQPTTLIASNIPTASFTLTAPLSWNTEYEWQVVATNAADRAVTYGPVWSFTTYPSASLPYSQDFSAVDGWYYSGGNNWTIQNSSNAAGGTLPEARFYFSPSTTAVQRLISKPVNTIGETSVSIEFKHYIDDWNGNYSLYLQTSSDAINWTTVHTFPSTDTGPETKSFIVISPDVGSDTFYVAWVFDGYSFNIDYWYIDDVLISEGPACIPPSNLIASNITNGSADLGWTENNNPPAASWNIEWGLSGFEQGTGTMVNGITDNPYSLTGLTSDTAYDWYVQADNGSLSNWVGPNMFTTLPDCIPPTNLIVTNLTQTSADLGWTENNTPPATSWNIEWGPTGFVQGEGTTVTGVSTNPYSLTGLTSETTYDWYVQAENNVDRVSKNSSSDALSNWAGPNTFTTLFDGIQIGYGSYVDKHLPIEPWYGYTYSQTIYQAADFGDPGSGMQIEKIWYNYSFTGGDADSDLWTIYMGTTLNSTLTDWIPIAQLTEVFNGDVDLELVSGIGWLEIVLDTPFIYDPLTDGNLVIAVDENAPGYTSSSDEFFCDQDTRANVSVYFYSDSTNPNPAAPPAITNSYGGSYNSSYYPNTRFEFGAAPIPDPPTNLTIAVDGSGNTVLNWDAVIGAGSYHVYASDTPDGVFADVSAAGAFAGTSWTSNAPMGEMKFFYVTADTAGITDQIPAGISTSRRNNQNENKPADRLRR